jgi:hypothetical protein
LLPQRLFQQSFFRERGFCLRFGLHGDGAGGFEALFHDCGWFGGFVFVVLGCRCASGARFGLYALLWCLSILVGFVVVAER